MSIAQTIKKMALEAIDTNSPLQFIEGEIHSAPPNIELRLKNNPKLIIPSEFIIVSEYLTKYKRTVNMPSLSLKNAEIEFLEELKTGDKVMVAAIQGGQSFFIIDRF